MTITFERFFADAFATLSTWFILSKANVFQNDNSLSLLFPLPTFARTSFTGMTDFLFGVADSVGLSWECFLKIPSKKRGDSDSNQGVFNISKTIVTLSLPVKAERSADWSKGLHTMKSCSFTPQLNYQYIKTAD